MKIKLDDLTGTEVAALINSHLYSMAEHSPPESIHALNLKELKKTNITVWSVWENEELVGCGALKEIDTTHGEIKSMKTSPGHLRKGVARKLLEHIIKIAKERNYKKLSLETGSLAAFKPAQRLYESVGFEYCKPFADYKEDPNSVFMTKELC